MEAITDPFSNEDYKLTLKQRMKQVQQRRPALTWRKLASEIPMQYTYLSKALNDESTHLNEDHVYSVCRALEFFPDETEFILLQRAHATARDSERKDYLYRKLRDIRQKRVLPTATEPAMNSSTFNEQIRYLFEPLCQVVHMALDLPRFREDPRRLCAPLSISVPQLKEILRVLSRNDYIEVDSDGLGVVKVHPQKIHFGPDHFLMRFHMAMVKSQMTARIAATPDEDKYGFLVTFTMDESSYGKVREEFKNFLKRVEKIAGESKPEGVYQLSFDLFKWM